LYITINVKSGNGVKEYVMEACNGNEILTAFADYSCECFV
jgi:hypothetical protein